MGYNATAKYFFTVKNQGAGAAGPFTVNVSGEGSFAIAGLAPGASATGTFRTGAETSPGGHRRLARAGRRDRRDQQHAQLHRDLHPVRASPSATLVIPIGRCGVADTGDNGAPMPPNPKSR